MPSGPATTQVPFSGGPVTTGITTTAVTLSPQLSEVTTSNGNYFQ